ncbi:hypothetical protein H8959_002871 [Pygathrix nigripes]
MNDYIKSIHSSTRIVGPPSALQTSPGHRGVPTPSFQSSPYPLPSAPRTPSPRPASGLPGSVLCAPGPLRGVPPSRVPGVPRSAPAPRRPAPSRLPAPNSPTTRRARGPDPWLGARTSPGPATLRGPPGPCAGTLALVTSSRCGQAWVRGRPGLGDEAGRPLGTRQRGRLGTPARAEAAGGQRARLPPSRPRQSRQLRSPPPPPSCCAVKPQGPRGAGSGEGARGGRERGGPQTSLGEAGRLRRPAPGAMATTGHVPTRVTARSHGNRDLTGGLDLPAWAPVPEALAPGCPPPGADGGNLRCPARLSTVSRMDLEMSRLKTLEHVAVTVSITHPRRGSLELKLFCSSGMMPLLSAPCSMDSDPNGFNDWTFSTVRCWGERARGTYRLVVRDVGDESFQVGILRQWQLTLYGSVWSPVDIRDRQRRSPKISTFVTETEIPLINVRYCLLNLGPLFLPPLSAVWFIPWVEEEAKLAECEGNGVSVTSRHIVPNASSTLRWHEGRIERCSWSKQRGPCSSDATQDGGTNNHENTAEEVAGGIEAIVQLINTRQPQAKIIVLGLLPRGEKPNPLRQKNAKVNQLLKVSLPKLANVQLLDTDGGFVHSDGAISCHDMFDFLHLTGGGYAKICKPLHELIMQLLEETPEEKQTTIA